MGWERCGAGAKADLWLLPLDGSGPATPWLETPANEGLATSSRQEDRIKLVLNWPRELARLAAAGRDER